MVDKLSKALQNSFKQDAGPAFDKELQKPKTKVNIDELLKSACSNDKINVHIILYPEFDVSNVLRVVFLVAKPPKHSLTPLRGEKKIDSKSIDQAWCETNRRECVECCLRGGRRHRRGALAIRWHYC
jgi:hypothetical protein